MKDRQAHKYPKAYPLCDGGRGALAYPSVEPFLVLLPGAIAIMPFIGRPVEPPVESVRAKVSRTGVVGKAIYQ